MLTPPAAFKDSGYRAAYLACSSLASSNRNPSRLASRCRFSAWSVAARRPVRIASSSLSLRCPNRAITDTKRQHSEQASERADLPQRGEVVSSTHVVQLPCRMDRDNGLAIQNTELSTLMPHAAFTIHTGAGAGTAYVHRDSFWNTRKVLRAVVWTPETLAGAAALSSDCSRRKFWVWLAQTNAQRLAFRR